MATQKWVKMPGQGARLGAPLMNRFSKNFPLNHHKS